VEAPAEVVRRFREAFNARDLDAFLTLVTEDVVFRNPLGKAERGLDAARDFLAHNEQMGVSVEQDGAELVDGQRVVVPTLMRLGDGTTLAAAGIFEVRDGRVASFQAVMDRASVGL
jgi:limonene-1,2-epoxide hydrolase